MRKNLYLLLIVALFNGLYSGVRAQTASWSAYKPALFPTNASGQIHGISRVSQMKFHPTNSQFMYAVSARGGLFISSNGGTSWSVAAGCDKLPLGTRFASVCIDHTNDQTIYLGGGDHNYYSSGSGVWKSTDGGASFTQTTLNNKIIVDMIMDPTNNSVIVAATNTGIYKTTNAGSTWTLKSGSIAFDDLKKKENASSRVLFASTRNAEIYRSTDFGETWTQITSGIYIPTGYTSGGGTRIGLTPADSNIVYFYMNAKGGTLFKSTDGGTSFVNVKDNLSPFLTGYTNNSADPGQGDYNTGIGVDRVNANIVYFVAHNVWKSTDGGVTWSQLTVWYQKVHTDMHQIVTNPYNNSQLWNMNDGGVWLSTDGGNNWSPKSDGIYGYEIYHGSCSPTRKDMMSIGTQDNGELYATSTGWFTNRGGDWQSHCVFDYRSNSSMVYYFDPDWGGVPVPKRRLVTGSESTYGLPSVVTDFTDIAFYRGNPDLAFVGDTQVFRTTNLSVATPTWTSILNTGVAIIAMHVNYTDPNKLYVITNDQKIWVTTNATAASPVFTSVTLPSGSGTTASITSVPGNSNVVYITCNNKAYRSIDNGATWTDITYNLPSYNHVKVLGDEYYTSGELVFVATGGTVYYKTQNATTWSIYTTSLPSRTSIVDMSIFNDGTANTALRVFTYGRGVWETPITNLKGLNANFTADNRTPCLGQTVNFSDLSTGSVTSRTWSFPGGTPATSTAANPAVVYNSSGSYTVTLTVSDGSTTSTSSVASYIVTSGSQLPLSEGFEGTTFPPSSWSNVDAGSNGVTWQKYTGAGGFGNSNNCMFFDNWTNNTAGAYDEFRSSSIDLSAYNSASLTFDLAYWPYSTSTYIDSLQLLVSTDCGATFTSVYLKFGSTLATVTGTTGTEFVPTASQWRTETINLNAYAGRNVVISFRNIGRYGNNIYIDNINLNATVASNAGPDRSVCSGSSVSIGSASATGFSYSWSPATGLSSSTISNPVASPSATTTYVLTTTYVASGVFGRDTVVVNVNNPASLTTSSTSSSSPTTANGTASVSITGGASPYTISWNTNPVQTTATATGLLPGTYIVTVTTSAGCTSTASVTVTANSTCALTVSESHVNASCFGTSTGSVFASSTGGSGIVSYTLQPFGNTNTSGAFSGLPAGNYSITATDGSGCTSSISFSITQPLAISVVASVNVSIPCNKGFGEVNISASGGQTPYNGTGIYTVQAGTAVYTVSDANNCQATTSFTMTEPSAVSPSVSSGTISCFGGTTTTTVSSTGGTPPYLGTGSFSAQAGTYVYTVTDSRGCTGSTSITVTQPSLLSASASAGTIRCNGGSATVTVSASGGTPAYSGTGSFSQTASTTIYTVVDSRGCSANTTITLTQPSLLVASATSGSITCNGGTTQVLVSATGGTTPYSGTNSYTSGAGTNTYTVTDANNCTATTSITITQPAPVAASITASGPTTFCSGGSVTLTASVGVSYLWSNGSTASSINVTSSGTFTVTATNANGCTGTSAPVTVTVNPLLTPTISITSNPTGTVSPATVVTFTATITNGGSSPSFQWKKNGVNVGTNSATYTGNSWVDGDAITCVLTSNANCLAVNPVTSNSVVVFVNSAQPKYLVVDISQNKAFYYDSTFAFLTANTMSTTVLYGTTNVSDVTAGGNFVYVLDGINKRIYRSAAANTVSTASRVLVSNTGSALRSPTGLAISGDSLWVLDKGGKAVYRYSLASAFSGTGNLSAANKVSLASKNSNGESLIASAGYLYVLDNGTTKTFYRYLKTGGTPTVSRGMLSNTGTALATVTGAVLESTTLRIVDSGTDRSYTYSLSSLFTGTGNLNATLNNALNASNLNSTGICILNSLTLLRENDQELISSAPEFDVIAYPNPTNATVNVRLNALPAGKTILQLYDLNGRMIEVKNLNSESVTDTEQSFELTQYPAGIYLLSITNGDVRKIVRIEKQ